MSSSDPSSPTTPSAAHARSRRVLAGTLAAAAVAVMIAAGCSSDSGSSSGPTLPDRSSTTTEQKDTTTTDRKDTTTTERATTTTAGKATTTTSGRATTTTKADSTTTTERATTTTEKETTTTKKEATTTTASTLPSTTLVDSKQDDVPWLALGALLAVAVLVLVLAIRSRSQRKNWWAQADSLLGDGRAVVDLGSAGPAATEPQAEIAHWATIEQRTETFGQEVQAMLTKGVPDDAVRNCLGGLGVATGDYLASVRNTRALRIGPPPATPEQMQYADAESAQRLAILRATLDQLDTLVTPHRKVS